MGHPRDVKYLYDVKTLRDMDHIGDVGSPRYPKADKSELYPRRYPPPSSPASGLSPLPAFVDGIRFEMNAYPPQ